MIKASEARRHPVVTTISKQGAVGIGRLIGGEVYVTLGNGYYGLAKTRPGGLATFHQDGGRKYSEALNGLALPVNYHA